jgi:Flp pilus assembly pilin Flp
VRSRLPGSLLADESGAAAAEYALILGAIAGVIALLVYALGSKVNNLYGRAGE